MDLALLDGVLQRADYVLLTDHVGKRPGAVAAVERRAS
jgi:hypothetical protein